MQAGDVLQLRVRASDEELSSIKKELAGNAIETMSGGERQGPTGGFEPHFATNREGEPGSRFPQGFTIYFLVIQEG